MERKGKHDQLFRPFLWFLWFFFLSPMTGRRWGNFSLFVESSRRFSPASFAAVCFLWAAWWGGGTK